MSETTAQTRLRLARACAALSIPLGFLLACALGIGLQARAVQAQSAPKPSLLERFLQDTLSSDNQNVKVTGLSGAFSSRATIELLEVSDPDGVWLVLESAELDWNRLALVRGRFSVNTLAAKRIDLRRSPNTPPAPAELPPAEAQPFALPELPVAIDIARIDAAQVDLGEALLGQAARLSITGDFRLADGALDTSLEVQRRDRSGDQLGLRAAYANDTRQLALALTLDEAPDGLLSTLLQLPDAPSLTLRLEGDGPLEDFTADLRFLSDAQERLTGTLALRGIGTGDSDKGLAFRADLKGDIDPLMAAEFRPFFGPGLHANLRGQTGAGGALRLDNLALRTQALQVTGALALSNGQLNTANLKLALRPSSGATEVVLPVPGATTTLQNAMLLVQKPDGNSWSLQGEVNGFADEAARFERAELRGKGQLSALSPLVLSGHLDSRLTGLSLSDPEQNAALTAALGQVFTLSTDLATEGPEALRLHDLDLRAAGLELAGNLSLSGLSSGLTLATDLALTASDLTQFAALAQIEDLAGSATAELSGTASPLSGAFDIALRADTQDLRLGQSIAEGRIDRLLVGPGELALAAKRDDTGLEITDFHLRTAGLEARAQGDLSSEDGVFSLSARLREMADLLPDQPALAGPVRLDVQAARSGDQFDGTATLDAARGLSLVGKGQIALPKGTLGDADLALAMTLPDPERFSPQLAGAPLRVTATTTRRDAIWSGQGTARGPAQSRITFDGRFEETSGASNLRFEAAVGQLQQLIPGLDGLLQASGTATRQKSSWRFDTTATGPLGITAAVDGQFDETRAEADLNAAGSLRLEGLNRFLKPNLMTGLAQFDLSLTGAPVLENLRGEIRTAGAELVLPGPAMRLDDIAASLALRAGLAQVTASTRPADGGRLTLEGPVALTPPFEGALAIGLNELVVTDHLSFDTTVNGQLRFAGDLAGDSSLTGRIDVGETNINLNTAGGTISSAPIPPITHLGQTAAQRATLERAGLSPRPSRSSASGSDSRIGLDVMISAPQRIFARGRGLNAELGGTIQVEGTTTNIAPAGQISLIRGTFDILGRRLKLDDGLITLLGDLQPYLQFTSSATTENGTATLEISGNVTSPQIEVTSEPARPSEEALALLLFGDNLNNLSPLVLARIASSALTLSGRGGQAQNRLRKETGADSVDIGVDNLGSGRLGLGGYLADNIYTDLNINTQGDSELTINLDLSRTLTATGQVASDGDTGIGLFFKRDY